MPTRYLRPVLAVSSSCRYLRGYSSACLRATAVCFAVLGILQNTAFSQFRFEDPPIRYRETPAQDRVVALAERLHAGEVILDRQDKHDNLALILKELDIPVSSQVLVFTKTSLQQHRISPEKPRAIYFNDDVYVGWVQEGYMLEFAAMDDHLGGVFYSLSLDSNSPRMTRDRGGCLACHASQRTQRVPGFFIRSVVPRADGRPLDMGTITDHRSPFAGRWGGWYVTGQHGAMRHLGNEVAIDPEKSENLDIEAGANVTDLNKRLDLSPYLSPHSDLVALMVMEHQMQMHNLITLANYENKYALAADKKESASQLAELSETARQRIQTAGDKLVDYALFCDEASLAASVSGTSGFTAEFQGRGQADSHGRSLRQLDLNTRLFHYPCSYLIHSTAFKALPEPVASYVKGRVLSILQGESADPRYQHLSPSLRGEIVQILRETEPGWFLPEASPGL